MVDVPAIVRRKALVSGAGAWLDALPSLVAKLEADWAIRVGRSLSGGHEAFVAEAEQADGTPVVLKILLPGGNEAAHEITALRLAGGDGCATLIRDDVSNGAMLLERLGRPLGELNRPLEGRLGILADTAMRVWSPAAGYGLPTGAEKGRWLVGFIERLWDELNQPCSERAVTYALACAERRIAAHDDERAMLVHGDVHPWNTLEAGAGFKLVDPDGLLAEAAYDIGILMREATDDLAEADPMQRAQWLAHRTRINVDAIWEWGAVQRLSSGLLCLQLDLQPAARNMLAVAERVAFAAPWR
jgi:streptomycin 6-kinase